MERIKFHASSAMHGAYQSNKKSETYCTSFSRCGRIVGLSTFHPFWKVSPALSHTQISSLVVHVITQATVSMVRLWWRVRMVNSATGYCAMSTSPYHCPLRRSKAGVIAYPMLELPETSSNCSSSFT